VEIMKIRKTIKVKVIFNNTLKLLNENFSDSIAGRVIDVMSMPVISVDKNSSKLTFLTIVDEDPIKAIKTYSSHNLSCSCKVIKFVPMVSLAPTASRRVKMSDGNSLWLYFNIRFPPRVPT